MVLNIEYFQGILIIFLLTHKKSVFTQNLRHKIAAEINYNLLYLTTLFYILGIISPIEVLYFIYCTLIITGLCLKSMHSRVHIFILGVFCALGQSTYNNATSLPTPPEHIFYHIQEQEEVVLIGHLTKMITFDGHFNRLFIESEYVSFNQSPGIFRPTTGNIALSVKETQRLQFLPGQRLILRAKLKHPTSFIGDGVFDYAKFLAEKDIWVTGFISNNLYIQALTSKHTTDISEPSLFSRLRFKIEYYRTFIGHFLDRTTPHAGLYRALLLGDKSQLAPQTIENFQHCGLAHILAISGLHIAVLSSVIYVFILVLLKRSTTLLLCTNVYKLSLILTLPIIFLYASLTGMQAPVSRALLMFILVVIATCIERVKTPLVLVAASALLLLIVDPRLLFQASFLLSYSAITGIALSLPLLQNIFQKKKIQKTLSSRIRETVLTMFIISTVATLATMPISLFFFHRISLIGPLTNLIVEPLICLVTLPLGFLALCSFPFSETVAQLFLDVGSLSIFITQQIVRFCAQLPFSYKWLPQPPLWLIIFFYMSLSFLFYVFYNKKRTRLPLVSLLLAMTFMWFSPYELTKRWRNISQINILDVGKGSANTIELAGGYNILVDGGGPRFSKGSIGERVIAPYLWKKGIQKIDAVYLTHGDADHYNGMRFILKQFSVKTVFIANRDYYNEGFNNFLDEIEKLAINIKVMARGEKHKYGEATLQCLENFTLSHAQPHMRNKGIVLRLEQQEYSVLLPGDIHSEEENSVATTQNIGSDILLASHHGSKTSSSEIFLKAVNPSIVAISANINSPYFPAPLIKERYKEYEIPYFSTGNHGTLTISISKNGLSLKGLSKRPKNPFQENKATELFTKKREIL